MPSLGILGIWSGGVDAGKTAERDGCSCNDDVDEGVSVGESGEEGEDVVWFVTESSRECID